MRDRLGEARPRSRRCGPSRRPCPGSPRATITGGAASAGVTAPWSASLPARSLTPGAGDPRAGARVAASACPRPATSATFAPSTCAAGLHLHAEHGEAALAVDACTGSEKRSVIASSRPSRSASPVSPAISLRGHAVAGRAGTCRRRRCHGCPPRTANLPLALRATGGCSRSSASRPSRAAALGHVDLEEAAAGGADGLDLVARDREEEAALASACGCAPRASRSRARRRRGRRRRRRA